MTQRVNLLVKIDMPEEMYVNDLREYVRDAIESWSGQFAPDDPLFGWFYEKKRLTIRPISMTEGHDGRGPG